MAPEVKFTSFGIPYLVEFANVTFRRKKRLEPPNEPYVSLHSNDSNWSIASVSDSECPTYPVIDKPESEGGALYIRFASERLKTIPGPPLSPRRLWYLKRRIANAVVAAGMVTSPGSKRESSVEAGSLYTGTYGQVVSALNSAGLTCTVCEEDSLPNGVYNL